MAKFLPGALDDMERAAAWYDEQSIGLGDRFLDHVTSALSRIDAYPRIGAERHRVGRRRISVRGFPMATFPFSLIYIVRVDGVVVVAVASEHRHPNYWRRRVR